MAFRVAPGPLQAGRGRARLLLLLGVILAGCAKIPWPFPPKPGPEATEAIYYVGAAPLALRSAPAGDVVAELPPGTQVSRTRLERGWAFVQATATGQKGWVDNAKLDWRAPRNLPTAQTRQATPSGTADHEATGEQAEPSQETAPAPAETSPPPRKKSDGTSVFDPY